MNLRVAGIREKRSSFVRSVSGGDVASPRVGRKIKYVAVSARRKNDRIPGMGTDLAREEISDHNPFRVTVDQNQIEHFSSRKHFDCAEPDLPSECLVSTQQKLLASLAA